MRVRQRFLYDKTYGIILNGTRAINVKIHIILYTFLGCAESAFERKQKQTTGNAIEIFGDTGIRGQWCLLLRHQSACFSMKIRVQQHRLARAVIYCYDHDPSVAV